MPVKIRLQRQGKKGKPFYHVVVADSRAPRDGRFIERLGTYNPNTNPATIDLDVARSAEWLQKGAQPTDTARSILSYRGALYKHHLQVGVRKGAFTQEEADTKFSEWLEAKEARIQARRSKLTSSAEQLENERRAAETKKKEERAKAIAAKNTPPAEETEAGQAEAPEAEAPAAETPVAEAPAAEAAPEAETEAPAQKEEAQAAEEAPAAKTEAPAEEDKAAASAETDQAPAAKASEDATSEEEEDKKKAE